MTTSTPTMNRYTTTEDGGTLPTEDDPFESNQGVGNTNDTIGNITDDADDTATESGSDTGLSSTLKEYQNIFLIVIGVLVVIIVIIQNN